MFFGFVASGMWRSSPGFPAAQRADPGKVGLTRAPAGVWARMLAAVVVDMTRGRLAGR